MTNIRAAIAASTIILLPGCGGDSKSPVGPDTNCIRGSLTLGAVRPGSVSDSDCSFPSPDYSRGNYDAYSVALDAGQVYHVRHQRVVAFSWDPYVEVLEPSGDVIASSNNDYQSVDSELFFIAPATGTYLVRAGALRQGDFGNYRLSIRDCAAMPIASTALLSGNLTNSDCVTTFGPAPDSGVADVFLFTASGSARTITVTSGKFTPRFAFAGPGVAFGGEYFAFSTLGSPARLSIPSIVTPGTYLVIIASASPIAGDGSYTIQSSTALSMARLASSWSDSAVSRPAARGR